MAYNTSKMKQACSTFTLIIDWVGYLALLLIGVYIIQKDQVWEKFTSRKSSFARYQEPITERPTILINVESSRLEYALVHGIHYSIDYWVTETPYKKTLKIGDNEISDKVTIRFEEGGEYGDYVKLTPIVKSSTVNNLYHEIDVNLQHPETVPHVTEVKFQLSNENNSISLDPWIAYDGDIGVDGKPLYYGIEVGSIMVATLTPEKTVNLPGACRDVSANELFFKELAKQLWLNCPTGCRPDHLGHLNSLSWLFGSYPICDVSMGSVSLRGYAAKIPWAFSDIFQNLVP